MVHDITMLFTYYLPSFESNIGYEDDILEFISNLHVQGAKFGKKEDLFGGKYSIKMNSAELPELFYKHLFNSLFH